MYAICRCFRNHNNLHLFLLIPSYEVLIDCDAIDPRVDIHSPRQLAMVQASDKYPKPACRWLWSARGAWSPRPSSFVIEEDNPRPGPTAEAPPTRELQHLPWEATSGVNYNVTILVLCLLEKPDWPWWRKIKPFQTVQWRTSLKWSQGLIIDSLDYVSFLVSGGSA